MELFRNTYAKINLENIKYNVSSVINKFAGYDTYIGVVKADTYGHSNICSVKAIVDGGCNYLAVATLEEALEIRKHMPNIPIMCLGVVLAENIKICVQSNITITVNSLEYLNLVLKHNCTGLKVHLKLNTGMNRLGILDESEVTKSYELLTKSDIFLEGIYTHIYDSSNRQKYELQISKFAKLTKNINISTIPIVHICASESLANYEKIPFANACRIGIVMYGFTKNSDLNLRSTFTLYSQIVQINDVKKGEAVGYRGNYVASRNQKIAVVSIGYADGINRKNTGRYVYIKGKKFKIVGDICMDMLFIEVDDSVTVYDRVTILKDVEHIREVAKHIDTIEYEVLCDVSKRVPRIYE